MHEIILRSNLNSPVVHIVEDTTEVFHRRLLAFLDMVSSSDSNHFIENEYILHRLLDCTQRVSRKSSESCPVIFDSWSCFNATTSGTVQTEPCPDFPLMKFSPERLAFKYCDTDGAWWVHPLTNHTWSNYTQCVDYQELNFHISINLLSLFGLCISLFFLVSSLLIFFKFESLSCDRVTVHKNLFISLTFSSFSWILWYYFVLYDSEVWSSNGIWCRVLHVITTYFTLTTYFWMLSEGTYLQLLLVHLNQSRKTISYLYFLGWVIPILIIIPYIVYRHLYEDDRCWMDMGDSNWFLGVPDIIVILLNIIFLANVIYILRSKLNSVIHRSRSERVQEVMMKQARATLFLMPILGVNYLLVPIRPTEGSTLENSYDVMVAVFSAFQGAFASLLLCFTNSEVIVVMRRRWNQRTDFISNQTQRQTIPSFRMKTEKEQKLIKGEKELKKQGTYETNCSSNCQ